jgi:ABC-type nitrate/sulfonate/bicarbonate transport system substrate-binding protein
MRISQTVRLAAAAAAIAAATVTPLRAADSVTIGTVGSASANLWPVFISMDKGFFTERNLKVDLIYIPSSAQVIQQLTSGSLDVTMSTGLVDPIRAIDKGSPIAIVRLEAQSPPYALVAKPSIKSMAELKGKVISVGGPKDITRIYVERMLAPHGVKPGEFDMVFAGATSARAQALLSNAVDAAIILPPFNFQAVAQGFNELGLTVDYAPELPFSGTVVNLPWAKAHQDVMARVLAAHAKATAWFEDDKNRAEAVRIMVEASKLKPDEVEKSYDFFRKGKYFEPTGRISRKRMDALVDALVSLGDIPKMPLERLILPGVTQTTD